VNTMQTAGVLFIAGSTIFNFGAGIGVPRIWTEPDPHARLRMLEERRTMWRIAQPFYGLGAITAGVGAGYLAVDATGRTRFLLSVACVAMIVGALAWCWSLSLRGTRIEDFVFGRQPAWPFVTYVLLTIAGLALLGAGLLTGDFPTWLGWLVLVADLAFLGAYVGYKDVPPFVFYLLLLVAGIALV
jgi:uncharacterized membrane protein YuzA (DUF378 family)